MDAASAGSVKVTVGIEDIFNIYSFLIRANSIQVSLKVDDLIDLLEISGNGTLNC